VSQQLNLFNPVLLRQRKYFSARTMVQALGLLFTVLALAYAYQRVQLAAARAQLESASRQFDEVQQQLTKFAAEGRPAPTKLLDDEIARAQTQLDAQEALLAGLAGGTLGDTTGFSGYLTALARQTSPGVWLTGFTASGMDGPLAIRGRMLRPELLPGYIRMLNREEALRGRGFAELRLSAREDKPQGAPPGADATPVRYVEFTLGATRPGTQK
jgi:hypothetical protein